MVPAPTSSDCPGPRPGRTKSQGKPDAVAKRPIVWLGVSVRPSVITKRYPALAERHWMASLGDAVNQPALIDRVFCQDLKAHLRVTGPVMLDSGGYTFMTRARGLTVKDVARIYARTNAELCVAYDLPPSPSDSVAIRRQKAAQSHTHLRMLLNALGPARLVPVVHGATRAEIASNLLTIRELLACPSMICIGGLVPRLKRSGLKGHQRDHVFAFIAECVAQVRATFPYALIHILGAGAPKTVSRALACGAGSTDSSAWRRAAGYGTIFLPGTSERLVSRHRRIDKTSRPQLNQTELELLRTCRCPACVEHRHLEDRLTELSSSYTARAAHNAFVVVSVADQCGIEI